MLGQHERGYPRNVLTRRLLERLGCTVIEAVSLAPGVLREAALTARFLRLARSIDVLFITEGGHRYVPVLAPVARALGIPVLFDAFTSRYNTYVEDRATVRPGTLRAHQLHWLDKLAMRTTDVAVFDTHEHARYFSDRYGAPKHAHVIEVGVDEATFGALPSSDAPGLEVLFYGTYIPLQGAHVIVDAAARLADQPDIAFTLVGTGQTHAEVAARVRALGLPKLTLRPPVPAAELPALIARAHVVLGIFGDTTKATNVVPNKVVQAAASARAIVTRRSPAVERYFEDGTSALLVEPSAEALAAALLRLRADPALRHALGQHARSVFERSFSERALAEKMARALEDARLEDATP